MPTRRTTIVEEVIINGILYFLKSGFVFDLLVFRTSLLSFKLAPQFEQKSSLPCKLVPH